MEPLPHSMCEAYRLHLAEGMPVQYLGRENLYRFCARVRHPLTLPLFPRMGLESAFHLNLLPPLAVLGKTLS